jgi:hypothetical protein
MAEYCRLPTCSEWSRSEQDRHREARQFVGLDHIEVLTHNADVASSGDADDGYIAPATLASCVQQAKSQGWAGGVMSWEFPHANAAWIYNVRSLSWPVTGNPPTTTTKTITTTKTTTTTSKTTATPTKTTTTTTKTTSSSSPTGRFFRVR